MNPEQEQEILRLRQAQLPPKQIARKLGLRPAVVSAYLRNQEAAHGLVTAPSQALSPLVECLANQNAIQWLLTANQASDLGEDVGLCQVIVTRQWDDRLLVASYLVDYWCLGVKNCIPPRKYTKINYEMFKATTASGHSSDLVAITLTEAQGIIYGAIDYARSLGFEPHPDFNSKSQSHLEGRPNSLIPLEFGRDGQPYFMSGPYDDSAQILATLEANVGADNFGFIAHVGGADRLGGELF